MSPSSGFLPTFFLLVAFINEGTSTTSVKHVHVIYRHGDRSPIKLFENIPGISSANWPGGAGQLTTRGMLQHFHLGKFLRTRYGHLLSPVYRREELRVRSSNYDRTLMSAQANLAGLFWNLSVPVHPELPANLIPIHTVDKAMDSLLLGAHCPRMSQLHNKFKKSLNDQMTAEERAFITRISIASRFNYSTANLWRLSDGLFCAKAHNFTLPVWVTPETYQNIMKFEHREWRDMYLDAELTRLRAGVLLGEIRDHLSDVSGHKARSNHLLTGRHMVVYSSHDTDVAALLSILGVYNGLSPPYCATILLELSQTGGSDWFVEVFYRNSSKLPPFQLKLPFCPQQRCPLMQFLSGTADKSLTLAQYTNQCSTNNMNSSYNTTEEKKAPSYIWVFVAIFILAVVLVLIGIIRHLVQNRQFVSYTRVERS